MAEEPQPPNVAEGADAPDALPANAEDRKAAQAMSSLDTKATEDEEAGKAPKKEIDLKALNDAMKNLGGGGAASGTAAAKKQKEEAPKRLIKVDQADVTLLADQLDMSKPKATELLRAHDADAVKAMRAWVTTAV